MDTAVTKPGGSEFRGDILFELFGTFLSTLNSATKCTSKLLGGCLVQPELYRSARPIWFWRRNQHWTKLWQCWFRHPFQKVDLKVLKQLGQLVLEIFSQFIYFLYVDRKWVHHVHCHFSRTLLEIVWHCVVLLFSGAGHWAPPVE